MKSIWAILKSQTILILVFAGLRKKSQKSKQTLNEGLKLPKLVAPKMWMAEKVSNFYKEARNA